MSVENREPTILYCNCSYAKVVPGEVKREVLRQLSASGRSFESVADLCEMSAKRDPALPQLMQQPDLRIAACYPRAVKWLCSAAGTKLSDDAQVINMRTLTADDVISQLFSQDTAGAVNQDPKTDTVATLERNENPT
ncbi:MAG: hypothetical protein JNK57_14955 [Planctomycetaceae bacterium]|nr:hypothetical protein [Planctomycetaceae bacterium]